MKNAIDYFWSWFTDNQKHYFNFLQLTPKLQKHYIFWLEWHLNYYSKGVSYVIVFPKKKNKKTKLIITAKGQSEYYEKVEKVVAAAPKFLNWEIIAFMQPTANMEEMINGTDKPFEFHCISLKASEIKFEPFEYENTKKIDLIIYIEYETIKEDYKELMEAVYIIIESILGEKFLHENIDFVELARLPEHNIELFYLYDLKLFLEEISK